jgi:hypothetical protein
MCVSRLTTTIFTGLKILHCQHTLVSSLPVGLHDLSLLEELHAHHCRLQTIDGRLGLLPHLHVMNCSSNPIWSPPSESLDLTTADLKRVLSGLVLTQQPHAVCSHIMSATTPRDPFACNSKTLVFRYRNRKCQLLGVAWDAAAGRMVATVKDVGTGQVGIWNNC